MEVLQHAKFWIYPKQVAIRIEQVKNISDQWYAGVGKADCQNPTLYGSARRLNELPFTKNIPPYVCKLFNLLLLLWFSLYTDRHTEMSTYGDTTQPPTPSEQSSANFDSLQASMIISKFRLLEKVPFGRMTLFLLIETELTCQEKEVWEGLQKLFNYMCAEYHKIYGNHLISKDWHEDQPRIYEMWSHFRELFWTGGSLKKLGYAAWDKGFFFSPAYRIEVMQLLCKIGCFAIRAIFKTAETASESYGTVFDI
ncbi:MAG: hypothetical protein Q9209_002182 [Squamulea sp. 1 TL-2023]